ncbi:MAG: hypothetical protein Q4B06_02020 [Candidatus Saccharibacteria bacterium]|nr:hypothetical protein [Candidatus Saccharibacteria bacterium]
MIQINLIPDVKLKLIRAQRQRNIVVSVAILVTIITLSMVVLTAIYVFGVQAFRDAAANQEIKKQYDSLRAVEDLDKTITIQNQLTHIDKTHANKQLTSRILNILSVASAKGTDNSVSILTFSFNKQDSSMTVTAQTDVGGFEAADVFKKNIEALRIFYKPYNDDGTIPSGNEKLTSVHFASNVVLSSLGTTNSDNGDKRSVSFSISFTYAPEVFSMRHHIESIQGLSRGNVTDSYVRLPSNLFQKTKPKTPATTEGQ